MASTFVATLQNDTLTREAWLAELGTVMDPDLLETLQHSGYTAKDFTYGDPSATPITETFDTGRVLGVIVTTGDSTRVEVMLGRQAPSDPWLVAWWTTT